MLKGLAREMDCCPGDRARRRAVAVHLIGAASDDMAFLYSMEEEAPRPRRDDPGAETREWFRRAGPRTRPSWATVQAHPILAATVALGARVVSMPRLEPASEVEERGLTFMAASENRVPAGQAPLGLWRAQQVALWRRRMAAAFASVEEWLP